MTRLMSRIERLVRSGAVTATRLGRDAMGDPGFVRDLRHGRQIGPGTEARLAAWLDAAEAKAPRDGTCAR